MSVQIFKGLLPLVLNAGPRERAGVTRELKRALGGYLASVVEAGATAKTQGSSG